MIGFLRTYFAPIMVGVVFLWSAVAIAVYRRAQAPPGAIVLRIGHWQLEASVREALEHMAEKYRREVNPNVYIVQDAIPEMVFPQWVTTQLMGGTAPDMLEMGKVPYHLLLQYYNRYFVPLSSYADQPNPHNKGTTLEGAPLRSTYKDGMREAYIEEMQQYMNIPLSQFGIRVFYNRDLLARLTGRREPPTDYRAFLAACEQIQQTTDPDGRPYIPIAGSKYHLQMWESMMMDPITYPVRRVADFNRDGFVGNDELYVAFKTGRVSFEHPAIRARYRMLEEIALHFQSGYTGLTRDEAVFLFAQERAVFISTGTWDARSLQEQAAGRFAVGLMNFPFPDGSDPAYGDLVEGPRYERPGVSFAFGIARTSKHPDVALDFLLFMAGQEQNEELNRIIGWIPNVIETDMDPFLVGFDPNLRGMYPCLNLFLGGETWVRYLQLYTLFQVQQITYEKMAAEFEPFYIEHGLTDFQELQKDWRRGMQKNERFLAGIRARALTATGEEARGHWIKYRALTAARQVWPEIGHNRQAKLVSGELPLPASGPYEYSPQVLEKIRERQR